LSARGDSSPCFIASFAAGQAAATLILQIFLCFLGGRAVAVGSFYLLSLSASSFLLCSSAISPLASLLGSLFLQGRFFLFGVSS